MALNRRPRRVDAIGGVIETMAAGRAGVRPTADGAAVPHTRARHWARLFEFESWMPSAVLGCPLAEAPLAMSAAPFARTKHSPSGCGCGSRTGPAAAERTNPLKRADCRARGHPRSLPVGGQGLVRLKVAKVVPTMSHGAKRQHLRPLTPDARLRRRGHRAGGRYRR